MESKCLEQGRVFDTRIIGARDVENIADFIIGRITSGRPSIRILVGIRVRLPEARRAAFAPANPMMRRGNRLGRDCRLRADYDPEERHDKRGERHYESDGCLGFALSQNFSPPVWDLKKTVELETVVYTLVSGNRESKSSLLAHGPPSRSIKQNCRARRKFAVQGLVVALLQPQLHRKHKCGPGAHLHGYVTHCIPRVVSNYMITRIRKIVKGTSGKDRDYRADIVR